MPRRSHSIVHSPAALAINHRVVALISLRDNGSAFRRWIRDSASQLGRARGMRLQDAPRREVLASLETAAVYRQRAIGLRSRRRS